MPIEQPASQWERAPAAKMAARATDDQRIDSVAAPVASTPMPVFGEAEGGSTSVAADGRAARVVRAKQAQVSDYMRKDTGREAVELSGAIATYKSASVETGEIAAAVRRVGSRIFYLRDGVWTDGDYKTGLPETRLTYASAEYFAFVAQHPGLKSVFALGTKIAFLLDGKQAIIVVDSAP
jgi:hypothetical protein